MTEQELLKNALPAFKKKYGNSPKECGYSHCGATNGTVVFAKSEAEAEAFIAAQNLSNKTVKVLCFLCLATFIFGTYGIFVGIEEKWSINHWYLLLGAIIALTIFIGYIHFKTNLRLDKLNALYNKTEIITFTEKELSQL
jgi:hypothetical protein